MATEPLNFHFPIALLLKEGDLILDAAEELTDQLAERLQGTYIADTRAVHTRVGCEDADQKIAAGELGTLTLTQDMSLKVLLALLNNAKETAKKAFKGNDVKLRQEFQIGINKPEDLASVLLRANIIVASLKRAENIPALTGKGWIAKDTQKLETAITALSGADATQESGKGTKLDATGTRNHDANELYERLDTIQHAAHLQFPETEPGTASMRKRFRLDDFPPKGGSGNGSNPPPPTPTNSPTK